MIDPALSFSTPRNFVNNGQPIKGLVKNTGGDLRIEHRDKRLGHDQQDAYRHQHHPQQWSLLIA